MQDRLDLSCELLRLGQNHKHTKYIVPVIWHEPLPVDIRHNAKIFREKLAVAVAKKYPGLGNQP